MQIAKAYYEDVRPDAFLELHLVDGTIRGVLFEDHAAKTSALVQGRAQMDGTAIMRGLLPRGAVFVSRAVAVDASTSLRQLRDAGGDGTMSILAMIQLLSSLDQPTGTSEHIDEQRDVEVRRIDPVAARGYDSAVDALTDADVRHDT